MIFVQQTYSLDLYTLHYNVYMPSTVSVRLVSEVESSAESYLSQSGWTRTSLINTALSEWLRIQVHSEIRFIPTSTGLRVAALINGPEIWTVIESWNQHDPLDRTTENISKSTGLSTQEVEIALHYYADFREEIDAQIARVHQAQDQARQAWERRQSLHA